MARTVRDLAALLAGMAGEDKRDPLTAMAGRRRQDFLAAIERASLRGARIGVWRRRDLWETENARPAAKVIERVLHVFEEEGATLIDPVSLPHWKEATGHHVGVMSTELRHSVDRYLAGLLETQVRTLDDVVAFNKAHADTELQWHPQNLLEDADRRPLSDPAYQRDLRLSRKIARDDFERAFRRHQLDAIIAPTFVRSWPINLLDGDPYMGNGVAGISNAAGYPDLTVPAGYADELPIGISFLGRAWDEPKLLALGRAFERAVDARRAPRYLDAGVDFVAR
jgi:amidase